MQFSEQTDKIVPAFVQAQAHFQNAKKDKSNPFLKSKYADLAGYQDACRDGLAEFQLALIQDCSVSYDSMNNPGYRYDWKPITKDDEKGKQPPPAIIVAKVKVRTKLIHISGQYVDAEPIELLSREATPQAVGSLMTYGRRYSMIALLGLASEDNDGNQRGQTAPPPELDKKDLRRYRATMNQALLKCKTSEQFLIEMENFESVFEYPLTILTGHGFGETFKSLSEEHYSRIERDEDFSRTQPHSSESAPELEKPEEDVQSRFNELQGKATDENGFRELEEFYINMESVQSPKNEVIVNQIGGSLGIAGYDFDPEDQIVLTPEESTPEPETKNQSKKGKK